MNTCSISLKPSAKAARIQNSETLSQLIMCHKCWEVLILLHNRDQSSHVFSSNVLYFYKYVYYRGITTGPKVCCLCYVSCATNFIPFFWTCSCTWYEAHWCTQWFLPSATLGVFGMCRTSQSHPPGSTLSCLVVVSCSFFFFLVMDRTVFSAICCAWPLRWWSTERVTPGRICSKSSLLVLEKDGGSRAWQHAGGLIRPLVKGQMQKTQPEEKAMQDVQPPSSLKLPPKPQLFRCMNKHAQLLSAEVALLALPSTVLFTPGSAKSSSAPDGNLEAKVRKSLFFFPGHLATFLLLLWSVPCFFSSSFSCEYLLSPHPASLGWSIALTDVSFEIEISSCSEKWLT